MPIMTAQAQAQSYKQIILHFYAPLTYLHIIVKEAIKASNLASNMSEVSAVMAQGIRV